MFTLYATSPGAGFFSVLEPVGLDRGDGKRPDGMTVFPFSEGRSLVWDATCSDTFAPSSANEPAVDPGFSARRAEERKAAKYSDLQTRYLFTPVSVETSGVFGQVTLKFPKDLGRRMTLRTGDAHTSPMASGWMTRLQDCGTEGTLALALALGHELGIFDVIMASPEPMTSSQIAEKGKLKERYVREWLGCMVAGEVVEVERGQQQEERYFIAEDHKQALDNIGIASRLFASYAVRYDAVKACFKQDGPHGVSHSEYPDVFKVFHVMRKSTASHTTEDMIPLVVGLRERLEEGIDVVDFGCGTGVLILEMARNFPNSRFHGSDISQEGIAIASQQLASSSCPATGDGSSSAGLTNVTFSCDDMQDLPKHLHERFDWALTYDVIHDLPHPQKALNEIAKCLKPGGSFVMGDIHTPKDRCKIAGDSSTMGLYGLSTFLCLPASAANEGALGPGAAWSVEEAQEMIAQCSGLELVQTYNRSPYFAYHVCRRVEPAAPN